MIQAELPFQTFELKGSLYGHEHLVSLGADTLCRRLCQSRVGLECLVKDLHWPSFLIDRFHRSRITVSITTRQIPRAAAAVRVGKDLAVE